MTYTLKSCYDAVGPCANVVYFVVREAFSRLPKHCFETCATWSVHHQPWTNVWTSLVNSTVTSIAHFDWSRKQRHHCSMRPNGSLSRDPPPPPHTPLPRRPRRVQNHVRDEKVSIMIEAIQTPVKRKHPVMA